jgi:hypothetical protein
VNDAPPGCPPTCSGLLVTALAALLVAALGLSACSTSNVRPPPIGDCTGEVGCTGPAVGGGSSTPSSDAAADAEGGDDAPDGGDDDAADAGAE